jgi:hypothetical protein
MSRPQGRGTTGRIRVIKNSSDSIENRTRGLQACSAMRQPTAPPRTPITCVLSGLTLINLAFSPHMFRTILRINSNCIKEQKTVALCNVGAVFSVRQELNFLMVCGWSYWIQRYERLCYVIVPFCINVYVQTRLLVSLTHPIPMSCCCVASLVHVAHISYNLSTCAWAFVNVPTCT